MGKVIPTPRTSSHQTVFVLVINHHVDYSPEELRQAIDSRVMYEVAFNDLELEDWHTYHFERG